MKRRFGTPSPLFRIQVVVLQMIFLVSPFMGTKALEADEAPPSAPAARPRNATAVPSVDAEVEVGLARVIYLLRAERYTDALEEALPLRDRDGTFQARYYAGVAYTRLELWDRAAPEFLAVAHSPYAPHFPSLQLETGIVLFRLARYDEARVFLELAFRSPASRPTAEFYLARLQQPTLALEQATPFSRDWWVRVSLGAGYDSNAAGAPATEGDPCPEHYIGTLEDGQTLPRSCGFLTFERLTFRFMPFLPGPRLVAGYQFQHLWYPDRTLRLFDIQDHRLGVTYYLKKRFSAYYQATAISLDGRYLPLYAASHRAAVRYQVPLRGPLFSRFEYQLGLERYGNLADIWDLEVSGGDYCPDDYGSLEGSSDLRYCTSGRNGLRNRGVAGVYASQPIWSWGVDLSLEATHTWDPGYQGPTAGLHAWSDARLFRRLELRATLDATGQRYEEEAGTRWTQRLRSSVDLMVPLERRLLLQLRYGGRLTRALDAEGGLESVFIRHLGFVEVSYAF